MKRYFSEKLHSYISCQVTKKREFLKKYTITNEPFKFFQGSILEKLFRGERPVVDLFFSSSPEIFAEGPGRLKSLIFSVVLTMMSLRAMAPVGNSVDIIIVPGIEPFAVLMNAVAMVETMGNNLAFNEQENAVGKLQIRQVRIDEYNRLTGNMFRLSDMFDPVNSEKVFLYFASVAGPYHFERIAKRWNGSGPKTELYWEGLKNTFNQAVPPRISTRSTIAGI